MICLFVKFIFWMCFFLLVYTYVLYPFLLILWDKISKGKNFKKTEELPKVSLVIAAFNEERVIKSRLENCLALDYPPERLEIIIASDGSNDRTNDIVRQYSSQGIILLNYKTRRGKINILNETVPRTSHDIIIFSDANTMFLRDAVKKLVRHFGDPRVGCVCGELQLVNSRRSKTAELEGIYWKYETMLKRLEGRKGTLLGANGAIYSLRKKLYQRCPSDTIVEDFVIPMEILRKGYYVLYDSQACAIEESAQRIIQEKQRRVRIGAGDFQAFFRLLSLLNPRRGFLALAFFSHKVLRWFAPFFLISIFTTNVWLLNEKFYFMTFLLQCIFYFSALTGQALTWSGFHLKIFNLCYYFVSMNLALLLGFVRYVTGKQDVAWQRTER